MRSATEPIAITATTMVAGRYSFVIVADIHADDPDKDLPEKEDLLIVSTWQADGPRSGRRLRYRR